MSPLSEGKGTDMSKETHEEAKELLLKVEAQLKDGELNAEDKRRLEDLQAELAGVIMSPWLPLGWVRRTIMLILFLLGLYGVVQKHLVLVVFWLSLLLFSPRISAEVLMFLGSFRKK